MVKYNGFKRNFGKPAGSPGSMSRSGTALGLVALACAGFLISNTPADAQAKLTSYPYSWDLSKNGAALPNSATQGALAFDDDFNTLSLGTNGATGVKWWAPIHSKLGTGSMATPPSAEITVTSGALDLRTSKPNAGGYDSNIETEDSKGTQGQDNTGFAFAEGYVEARINLPEAHGSHAGFWLLNVQTAQGHGEIDNIETYGDVDHVATSHLHFWPTAASRFASTVSATHYFGIDKTDGVFYGAYHLFGTLLTPTQICNYIDRKLNGCITRIPEMQGPFYILLSDFTDANRKDGYQPADMKVDYVKVWKPVANNMPAGAQGHIIAAPLTHAMPMQPMGRQ